ncbi:MAG: NADP-dependent malic enzyme [Candidatus Lernaella stagnicola]|nr:NADP-dependent malic enzyme [Candidatus Lernaella stagnicola]
MSDAKKEALEYHSSGRPGKIEVVSSKPCQTSKQLSLAYTPGVAEPCREIHRNPDDVFKYTARGNLVAVVSNGTAVLGLGNIGPKAAKPVMEGKGVLFKRFADIDVFDLELDTVDPEDIIRTVKLLEPTFGGINLEDIKAPDCFIIEKRLQEMMDIPVFHDDQHGTAIIAAAALINACKVTDRTLGEINLVFNGAGAAGLACADLLVTMGADRRNVIFCDSRGVIYQGRKEGMNEYKDKWAANTDARTLSEALRGADVFIGVSVGNLLTGEMIQLMAARPIIFAMANPDPEISPPDAKAARPDAIIATGRSDFPNQVNNVLGFPFIFRGALDVQARKINNEMMVAAAFALAELAQQDVPDSVARAYGGEQFSFGPDYIIPKPFDPRVLLWVAPAVAKAAIESGVARIDDFDLEGYRDRLERLLGPANFIMRNIVNIAKRERKRIVYPEGDTPAILRAVNHVVDEKLATPVLLGNEVKIRRAADELNVNLSGCEIVDTRTLPQREKYIDMLFQLRWRKGMTHLKAERLIRTNRMYLGALMLLNGEVDGLVGGVTRGYADAIRPVLQVMGREAEAKVVAGVYMMLFKNRVVFLADCTINRDPTAEQLADIAMQAADKAMFFGVAPRVAILAYSNFGSVRDNSISEKTSRAAEIVKARRPDLEAEGEMQADVAVNYDLLHESWPQASLTREANVLVFPDLMSGNAAYKLLRELGGAVAVGPLLTGIEGAFNVLQRGSDPDTIVNLTAVTVCQASGRKDLGVVKD